MTYEGTVDTLIRMYGGPKAWYYYRSVMSSLPIFGSLYKGLDNMAYMEDYMDNRGLNWGDIKYPSRTVGAQGVAGAVSFVSSNIERLYK